MLEVKLWNNDKKEYGTYYFEDISELGTYLSNNNVTLIWKREV